MKQLLSRHLSIATADFWGYKARQLFRNLLLVSVLLSLNTFSSFAQFRAEDWYNLSSSSVEKELDCSPILKFTLTATNDGDIQFQILNGEIGYTSGVDMVDNGVGLTTKAGSDGKVLAWQTPSVKAGETFVFYLDPSTYPLKLLPSMPTGTQVYMNLTSGKTAINYNDTVMLEAMPCPGDYTGDFVWQTSSDGSTWKDINFSTKNVTYIQNTDSTYYRVGITDNGSDIFSAPLLIYFKPLQLSLNANGTTLTNRVYNDSTNSSAVEFEVPRWSTIKFSPNWLGKAKENITLNKIYKKKLSESSWAETTLEGEDFGWEILADDNIEFKILANIEKEDGNIEYTMHVIVRATLECDETTIPDTLWFDDFGRFEDESTYVFERYDPVSKTKTEETASSNLTDNEGNDYDIFNFWASDPNNSVREHKFALTDENSGPYEPANCASDNYAHYACWEGCNGYRIEDGFFAICPDPNISNCGMTERDYWKGGDHTGNANGGMLFVNCADVVDKVIYEKEISLDKACNNAMLLFDAYVNNATRKQSNAPVNVRLDVFDSNGTLVHSVSSGDIYPRSDEKHNWAKLSFLFPASGMQYKIQIVNNMPGGSVNAGNDILLDDICISICYPSIDLLAESLAGKPLNSVETCELDDAINLYAFNKNGIENYISKPLYLFQYNKSEVGGEWITIPNDTSSSRLEITPRDPETKVVDSRFVGMTRIRAIVASRTEIINDICAGNPPVVDCDNVYAIDSSFVLNVNYSGPMGLQLDTAGCVNEVMNLNGEPNGRVKFAWVKIGEGASADTISREISYKFTIPANNQEGKVDSFMFYAFEKLGCVDSQLITVRTKEFVKFTVPETDFVVCEDESKVTLTSLHPAKLDNIAFRWRVTSSANDTIYSEIVKASPDYTIPTATGSKDSLKGKVFVEMYAVDSSYCSVDKSFNYDIHHKYNFDLKLSSNIKENTLCVSEEGTEIQLDAIATPESTARPNTFYWYRQELKADGSKDTTLVLTTNSNTFKETITGNHTYVYFVSASDGVCYKDQAEANANVESSNDTVEARLPLDLSLRIGNAKSDSICDGSEIELKAIVDNSLTSKTDIVWTYTGITNGLENETISSGDTTIKRTPVSSSDFMESGVVTITATDKVCTDNNPKSEVTYKMFKNIKLALEYDRKDSLFCLEEGKENKICLTANVSSGNPSNYYWYKNGEFIGSTKENKNCIAISDGKNDFSIKVTDDVCILDTANAASAKDSLPIEARLPIKLAISPAKDSVCFGESLNYSVVVTNPLNDNTTINWAVKDAKIEKATTTGNKVSNVVTPTIEGSRTSDGSVTVTTTDEVCTTNKPAATADYKVFRKIGLKFDVSLTDDKYFCLSTTEANNTMTVTAKDTTGEPALYIWYMDGKEVERTTEKQHTYTVTDGVHNFHVVVLDNVCHKEGGEPYKVDYDFEARYPVELTLASDKSVICEGDEIEFNLTAKNLKEGDTKVAWSFDKNSINVSEQTAETTIKNGESSTSKTYSPVSMPDNFDGSRIAETRDVIVSVKDDVCNKNATNSLKYSLRKKFKLSLVAPDVTDGKVCAKTEALKSVTVNAVVSRGEPKKFIWSDGKESAALVNTNTFALSVGENNIGVKVSDGVCPDLSTSAGDSLSILIREPISVEVTSSIQSPMCINKEVVFTANVYNSDPSSKTSIWWDNAELGKAETISNGKYVSNPYKFPIGDVYENIVVNFKEADGKEVCPQSSALYTMKVQDTVEFVIDASSYGVCQDTSSADSLRKIKLTLNVLKGSPQSVVWFNDTIHTMMGFKDSIEIVPMKDSVYWAYVKDDVCIDSDKEYLSDTVVVAHKMHLDVKAADASVQMGSNVNLIVIPSNPLYSGSYEWFIDDSTSTPIDSTVKAEFEYPLDTQGDYVFYVKTVNSVCGDVFTKVEIEVADYTNIPNAFTPDNGNAKNDVFMKGYMVQIFNRYQQVVYEGTDGWDGTYRGQLAEPGTYFYRLLKKDGRVLKGTIELTKF